VRAIRRAVVLIPADGFRPVFPGGTCEFEQLGANFVRFFTKSVSNRGTDGSEGVFAQPTTQPEIQYRWLIF
jgi:hypothetical protein